MLNLTKRIYQYFFDLPDKLYPFKAEIEGRWVRGRESYKQSIEKAVSAYGPGRFGYKLTIYRQAWHLVGTLLVIILATILARNIFGSDVALYVLLGVVVLGVTYQEFDHHPKIYNQRINKSVTDWSVWVLPIMIYLFLFLH